MDGVVTSIVVSSSLSVVEDTVVGFSVVDVVGVVSDSFVVVGSVVEDTVV